MVFVIGGFWDQNCRVKSNRISLIYLSSASRDLDLCLLVQRMVMETWLKVIFNLLSAYLLTGKEPICYRYFERELCYINRNSQQFVPAVVHKIWSCFEISLKVFSEVIVIC